MDFSSVMIKFMHFLASYNSPGLRVSDLCALPLTVNTKQHNNCGVKLKKNVREERKRRKNTAQTT